MRAPGARARGRRGGAAGAEAEEGDRGGAQHLHGKHEDGVPSGGGVWGSGRGQHGRARAHARAPTAATVSFLSQHPPFPTHHVYCPRSKLVVARTNA